MRVTWWKGARHGSPLRLSASSHKQSVLFNFKTNKKNKLHFSAVHWTSSWQNRATRRGSCLSLPDNQSSPEMFNDFYQLKHPSEKATKSSPCTGKRNEAKDTFSRRLRFYLVTQSRSLRPNLPSNPRLCNDILRANSSRMQLLDL